MTISIDPHGDVYILRLSTPMDLLGFHCELTKDELMDLASEVMLRLLDVGERAD